MKVGVVTDTIDEPSPGLNRYTRRLTEQLSALDSGHEFTFVHRREHEFYRGRPQVIISNRGGKVLRKQVVMPLVLRRHRFDLVHDTYHFPPFLWPTGYARVMTIADLTPLLVDTHAWQRRLAHRLLLTRLARRAHHIITISESTKADVVRHLRIGEDRVTAVPLAADETLAPLSDQAKLADIRDKYGLPAGFLLHVGTIEPRKNLPRLVEAFGRVASAHSEIVLALAGSPGWRSSSLEEVIRRLGLTSRIRRLGYVPDEDLPALYSAATALVYPSLYEGFGLPPLEAMQCGTPVVTSNVSSLPEVVGDAAITVNPYSVDEIAHALATVVADAALREELRAKGIEQAKKFSWRKCAEETIRVYERVVGNHG